MHGEGAREQIDFNLDGRTAYHVASIVDNPRGVPETALVHAGNIEAVLDSTVTHLRKVRVKTNERAFNERWQGDPLRHLQDVKRSTSAFHAIQCPVNAGFDLEFLSRHV